MQLGFLLELLALIPSCKRVEVHDPVFSGEEIELLKENVSQCLVDDNGLLKGLEVLEVGLGQDCARRAAPPNELWIFYMPHCPAELYNNLLCANARQCDSLRNVVIIGNDLTQYDLR